MWKMKRLNEVFPDWLSGGGIFSILQLYSVPWKDKNIALSLDLEYFGNLSGGKFVSPLVNRIMTGSILTNAEISLIAKSIVSIYGLNWSKQWKTMFFEYNPVENYSMTETMNNDTTVMDYGHKVTRTDDLTYGKTGTETISIDETDTRTDDLTHSKTGTETITIEETNTRTDDLTHGKTGTETISIDETDTRTDDLTHGKTGTETESPNITDTTTPNLTTNNKGVVHGFNSNEGVPADEQSQTESGTNTLTHVGTNQTEYALSETDIGTQTTAKNGTNKTEYALSETDNGTQTVVKDSTNKTEYALSETDTGTQTVVKDSKNETIFNTQETDTGTQMISDSGADTETRNYNLTRSGNIGVTTSQEMITSEQKLWVWNFFHDVVFPDIDKVLTIPIY